MRYLTKILWPYFPNNTWFFYPLEGGVRALSTKLNFGCPVWKSVVPWITFT